jgi:hypothetical protein
VYKLIVVLTVFTTVTTSARGDSLSEIAQFAESICGDIPEGNLTRTAIQGKVEANSGAFAKLVGARADVVGSQAVIIYKGIPFDKLPDKIPTASMCKRELAQVLLARKIPVLNTCARPEFGQLGWNRTEDYSDSSGRLPGGYDQNWWCNRVASSFIQSRSIGPQSHWERLTSSEEPDRDWKGHVTYKYHCTIRVEWDPRYATRQDPLCGIHYE